MNIDQIITEMERRVLNDEPITPGAWVESALRVNALCGTLDNELALFEASIMENEVKYLKDDLPASKAKILAKNDINYREYLMLKAKRERIAQFIMLAKRRGSINEY